MFQAKSRASLTQSALTILDLIYHNTVRSVRSGHSDALFAILASVVQSLVMILTFFFFMDFMGMRQAAVRGDFLLYVMSGIFVFMVHIKAVMAVAGAEGPTSPMMQHLPMTTTISIWAGAFSALYVQAVSLGAILGAYHLFWKPLEVYHPVGAILMLILAWASGCAIGSVFLAVKPWAPRPTGIAQQIYVRLNMFASGKMFLANMMTPKMIAIFSWNPLFHIIDQGRGEIFLNYNPMKSNLTYPIVATVVLLVIGLLGESYTRKRVSASWAAGK